jgi:hypothetical protein
MTVFGRIAEVVVDSIKLHAKGAWTHVSIKVFEAIDPTITDRDFSTAVVMVVLQGWGEAALAHV